ncbi:MAG: hypothetical protein WBA95_08180, partial [Mycolicibacter algericus]
MPAIPIGGAIGVLPRIPLPAAPPIGCHVPPDTGPRAPLNGADGTVQLGGTDKPPSELAAPEAALAAPEAAP